MRLGEGNADEVRVNVLPEVDRDDGALVELTVCE